MRIKRIVSTILVILSLGFITSFIFDPPFRPAIIIATSETADFGIPREQLATYELQSLKPLAHSPYVYCQFESQEKTDSMDRRIHVLGFLIDTAQGRLILSLKWDNFRIWPRKQLRVQLIDAFVLDGTPQLLLECFHIAYPEWFNRLRVKYPSLAQSLGKIFVHQPSTQYVITPSGTLRRNKTYPKILYPSSQAAQTFTGGDSPIGDMFEFQLGPDKRMTKSVWNGAKLPYSCVPIQDRAYMGLDLGGKAFTFYLRGDPPAVRAIGWDSIYTLYPQLRREKVESRAHSLQPPQVIPLTSQPGQPCLLFVSELPQSSPVVEVQADQLAAGSPRDIFKIVADFLPIPPLAAMRNNEVLILAPSGTAQPDLVGAGILFITEREKNPDGTWGRFSMEPAAIPLPPSPSPRRFSRIPLDAEHLLFYRDQALWTVRWDGKEETQVFPAAPSDK